MSLLEDMKAALDEQGDYGNTWDAATEIGAKMVNDTILNSTRWGYITEEVFQRDDEFVAVCYEDASGDSEVPFEPDVYPVVAQEVTVTKYVKVANV